MNIKVTIWDNRNEIMFECTQAVSNLKISTYIRDDPGKCTFDIRKSDALAFWEGASVLVWYNQVPFFKGYVFSKKRKKDTGLISVTCYDGIRYLKNKDAYVFEGVTSHQIFARICDDFVLEYKIVDPSSHVCTPKVEDNTALYQMIQTGLDDTIIHAHKWFFIRDNFGVLEHVNVMSCDSGLLVGDASGVIDLDYETSIDKDTYNQIKLYRDNKSTGKRDLFIVNDTVNSGETLRRWGILQYYEKVDENLNIAQIEAKARGMLGLFNNVKRTLKINSLSSELIRAGSLFRCRIKDLGDLSIDRYLLVTACTHSFENNHATMEITTEVLENEW